MKRGKLRSDCARRGFSVQSVTYATFVSCHHFEERWQPCCEIILSMWEGHFSTIARCSACSVDDVLCSYFTAACRRENLNTLGCHSITKIVETTLLRSCLMLFQTASDSSLTATFLRCHVATRIVVLSYRRGNFVAMRAHF